MKDWLPSKQREYDRLAEEGTPYVWKLKLTEADFEALESAIRESIHSHHGSWAHLLEPGNARLTVIYLAEWYKRRYCRTDNTQPLLQLSTEERKTLWENADICWKVFVYSTENTRRWQESLQALGGLAIRDELRHEHDEKEDPFLAMLCSIFNGDTVDIDLAEDRYRAVAVQQSISLHHSLYEYLKDILSPTDKNLPFSRSEIEDKDSAPMRLVNLIRRYNSLYLQDKFDIEWRMQYFSYDNEATRNIKIRIRPQNIEGNSKTFLSFELLKSWGIENPESLISLSFDLVYFYGGLVVKEGAFDNRSLLFQKGRSGFIVAGDEIEASLSVPTAEFDRIELWAKDNTGKTVRIQKYPYPGYLQLYTAPGVDGFWTSKARHSGSSILIFNSDYHLKDPSEEQNIQTIRFRNGKDVSGPVSAINIIDNLTIVNPVGVEFTFFNRCGFYQVLTKQYADTIRYNDQLFVTYRWVNLHDAPSLDEADEEYITSQELQLMFGREGLTVRFFPKRDSNEWIPYESYLLEFRDTNGRYVKWGEKEPPQGHVYLRITVRGQVFKHQVYYVPFQSSKETPRPIWRGFNDHSIHFGFKGMHPIKVDFPKDHTKVSDTVPVDMGSNHEQLHLEVYRPILISELYQNGKLIDYIEPSKEIELPMILCDQFSIRDFNKDGVVEIDCKEFQDGYTSFDALNAGTSKMQYYQTRSASDIVKGFKLKNVEIYLTKPGTPTENLFEWDMKSEPKLVTDGKFTIKRGVAFQALIDGNNPRNYLFNPDAITSGDFDDDDDDFFFGFNDDSSNEISDREFLTQVSVLKPYFFLFERARKAASNDESRAKFLINLMKEFDFKWEDFIVENLYRFAKEFNFDWMLIKRSAWVKHIESLEEEDKEKARECLFTFFRMTPKCNSSSERLALDSFLTRYWDFNETSSTDTIAKSAVKLILGEDNPYPRNDSPASFLKKFNEKTNKYSELSRILISKQ